jgi:hypothetical protein
MSGALRDQYLDILCVTRFRYRTYTNACPLQGDTLGRKLDLKRTDFLGYIL